MPPLLRGEATLFFLSLSLRFDLSVLLPELEKTIRVKGEEEEDLRSL